MIISSASSQRSSSLAAVFKFCSLGKLLHSVSRHFRLVSNSPILSSHSRISSSCRLQSSSSSPIFLRRYTSLRQTPPVKIPGISGVIASVLINIQYLLYSFFLFQQCYLDLSFRSFIHSHLFCNISL